MIDGSEMESRMITSKRNSTPLKRLLLGEFPADLVEWSAPLPKVFFCFMVLLSFQD